MYRCSGRARRWEPSVWTIEASPRASLRRLCGSCSESRSTPPWQSRDTSCRRNSSARRPPGPTSCGNSHRRLQRDCSGIKDHCVWAASEAKSPFCVRTSAASPSWPRRWSLAAWWKCSTTISRSWFRSSSPIRELWTNIWATRSWPSSGVRNPIPSTPSRRCAQVSQCRRRWPN